MNGLSPQDFERKLKRLNPHFRVDHTRIAFPNGPEFPTCGLYHKNKYIMGIPQYYVPEYSIAGVNFTDLELFGKQDAIKYIRTYGFIPDGSNIEERILWRGYKCILAELCRRGLIKHDKAQRLFKSYFLMKQPEFPREYIQRDL